MIPEKDKNWENSCSASVNIYIKDIADKILIIISVPLCSWCKRKVTKTFCFFILDKLHNQIIYLNYKKINPHSSCCHGHINPE